MRGWMCALLVCMTVALAATGRADDTKFPPGPGPWISIAGGDGPGKGKLIVLIAADEEYRSEETLPQLAQILAKRHGFNCVVLFGIDPKDGTICPNVTDNIPGLEILKHADLLIMLMRWRNLPDSQIQQIVDYAESGRPMIGMRTATHPFQLMGSAYQKYSWDYKGADYEGGFGRQVFGETWVAHHGEHGKQGTRGIFAKGQEKHPILKGIAPGSIYGVTDVYGLRLPLPGDSQPLVLGEVTETQQPDSPAVPGPKNDPMMPVAWTKTYRGASGKTARVFMTTLGASQDFAFDGTRRMLVNAVYWSLGMEKRIPAKSAVDFVGEFKPSPFKFRTLQEWKPGQAPADLLKSTTPP
ncbi:MAG TPA: ThuA domain-containing protein [Chthonomonadaceae bacterium]|nr:ThuA domain-containing protein [Chthonomonadaceae bacterium]